MGVPVLASKLPALTTIAGDQANAILQGTITATATAALGPFAVFGDFNFAVWGTTGATTKLQKTFDGGTTYIDALMNTGSVAVVVGAGAIQLRETERGVAYIANCTTFGSGTLTLRFSATGGNAQTQG